MKKRLYKKFVNRIKRSVYEVEYRDFPDDSEYYRANPIGGRYLSYIIHRPNAKRILDSALTDRGGADFYYGGKPKTNPQRRYVLWIQRLQFGDCWYGLRAVWPSKQ